MPRIQVPERYASALAELVRLSPEELAAFLKAMRAEKPSLTLDETMDGIADRLSIDRRRIDEIVRLLTGLQIAREIFVLSVGDLVSELRTAIEASGKEELRPPDWNVFQDAIAEALSEEGTLAASFIESSSSSPEALEPLFNRLTGEWKNATLYSSSPVEIAMHPAYQRIIGLGRAVVPLIIGSLAVEPDHWFWALKAITGEDPVPAAVRGNLSEMAKAWLLWGQERGLGASAA